MSLFDHRSYLQIASPLLIALALLQACDGSGETAVAYELLPSEFMARPASAVDPTAVPASDDTSTSFYVFRQRADWAAWWNRVNNRYNPQPLPSVDFTTNSVAGIYLGMRSNSCYALIVNDVVQRGGTILVRYHEARPAGDDICSPVAVYPLALIKIQATGLPIKFVEE